MVHIDFKSTFQLRKLQDKVAKGKEQVQKTKEQYELNLQDINSYNAKYMEVRVYYIT